MSTNNGTTAELDCVSEIGVVAGEVWHTLRSDGSMTLAKLARELDAPRDVVMQAIGWLAREGKVDIQTTSRGRLVSLR